MRYGITVSKASDRPGSAVNCGGDCGQIWGVLERDVLYTPVFTVPAAPTGDEKPTNSVHYT